jgi:hypothetical protein
MSRLPDHLQVHADAIPSAIRAQLGPAEVYARAAEACRIISRADGLGLSPIDHRAWRDRARAVLTAMPRAKFDAELAQLGSQASATGDHVLARGYRERATALKDANPQISDADLAKAARAVRNSTHRADHLIAAKTSRTATAGMLYKKTG